MKMTTAVRNTGLKAIFIGLIMAIILAFSIPTTAFANPATGGGTSQGGANNGVPDVKIGPDGAMTITGSGFSDGGDGNAWTQIIKKYRVFIVGISGIAAITMVVIFIFQFLKLGASAGNPQARSQALTGLLWSGIAAAGLGAVSLIVGLFYRAVE